MEKRVKVITKTGKILTINIIRQDEERIIGSDKYGVPVVVKICDIDSMIPLKEVENGSS